VSADVQTGFLPSADDVRGLLNGLFDRAVSVHEEDLPVLRGADVHVVASYVDDAGALRAVAFCDVVLGNVLGAALALVPPPRVAEALASGAVAADLADNTREVLNVAASMFNQGEAHLLLRGTWVVPELVAPDVVGFLREPCRRADLRVEVPGYGRGVIALLLR
jgi:hypothetical protein